MYHKPSKKTKKLIPQLPLFSLFQKMSIISVVPKMLKDKEVRITALDDKSVVYEMGNHSLNDDDFEYMGFSEVYHITERAAPISGTYYQIGSGEFVVVRKDGIYIINKSWDTYEVEERHNCLVVIQVAQSGVMYIKY